MAKFGLVVQPGSLEEARQCLAVLRFVPAALASCWLRVAPPVFLRSVGTVRSAYAEAEGFQVCCPLLPADLAGLPERAVSRKVAAAVGVAFRAGASVVGLAGPLFARWHPVPSRSPPGPVTGGASYTVCAAVACLGPLARAVGLEVSRAEVVILDAATRGGSLVAELLSDETCYLTLVDRNRWATRVLARRLLSSSGTAARVAVEPVEALGRADIVVLCGEGSPWPRGLRPGAVVLRLWPWSAPGDEPGSDGAVRVAEVLVDVPGEKKVDFGSAYPGGTAPSFMAEAMLVALEEEEVLRHGELTPARIRVLQRAARKHGFAPVAVRANGRIIKLAAEGGAAPENC